MLGSGGRRGVKEVRGGRAVEGCIYASASSDERGGDSEGKKRIGGVGTSQSRQPVVQEVSGRVYYNIFITTRLLCL